MVAFCYCCILALIASYTVKRNQIQAAITHKTNDPEAKVLVFIFGAAREDLKAAGGHPLV